MSNRKWKYHQVMFRADYPMKAYTRVMWYRRRMNSPDHSKDSPIGTLKDEHWARMRDVLLVVSIHSVTLEKHSENISSWPGLSAASHTTISVHASR